MYYLQRDCLLSFYCTFLRNSNVKSSAPRRQHLMMKVTRQIVCARRYTGVGFTMKIQRRQSLAVTANPIQFKLSVSIISMTVVIPIRDLGLMPIAAVRRAAPFHGRRVRLNRRGPRVCVSAGVVNAADERRRQRCDDDPLKVRNRKMATASKTAAMHAGRHIEAECRRTAKSVMKSVFRRLSYI